METDPLSSLKEAFSEGFALEKCRACGCMAGALDDLESALGNSTLQPLAEAARVWRELAVTARYDCLGCDPCHAARAINALAKSIPLTATTRHCDSMSRAEGSPWPPVPGDYRIVGRGADRPVAVSTLGSPDLALAMAEARPAGLCIVGKTDTENVGVEKVVRNLLGTPEVRILILAGRESAGHGSGSTFLALAANGVDERMRVIGSTAPRPVLINLSPTEVARFRAQVAVVDMVGCEDVDLLAERVSALATGSTPAPPQCGCSACGPAPARDDAEDPPGSEGTEPVTLDSGGYVVILLRRAEGLIEVEHYDYQNRLLHAIRGRSARGLCRSVLDGGWISRLNHAAYLGRELARAEAALRTGDAFVQDRA